MEDSRPKKVVNLEPYMVEGRHHYHDGSITLTFTGCYGGTDGNDKLKVVRIKGDRYFASCILGQLKKWASMEREAVKRCTEDL